MILETATTTSAARTAATAAATGDYTEHIVAGFGNSSMPHVFWSNSNDSHCRPDE